MALGELRRALPGKHRIKATRATTRPAADQCSARLALDGGAARASKPPAIPEPHSAPVSTLHNQARLSYGIHTFDWTADWAARAKPAAMAANCAHPARMVLGPGGL